VRARRGYTRGRVGRLVVAIVLSIGLAACDHPIPARDGGGDDVGRADAGPGLPVMVASDGVDLVDRTLPHAPRPPDWSCLDAGMPETPGPFGMRPMRVVVWRANAPLVGACVRAYAGDVDPADACAASDPRTDELGDVTISAPLTGPATFRILPVEGLSSTSTVADSLYFAVADASPGLVAIPAAAISEATLHLGLGARPPGTAVVGVVVNDCMGAGIYGATLRLARADGSEITARDGARTIYTDGASHFDTTLGWTHSDGIAGAMNVPVSSPGEVVYAEVFGRFDDGSLPALVACARMQLLPDGNTLASPIPIGRAGSSTCPVLPVSP
jgi:hypothetical protein